MRRLAALLGALLVSLVGLGFAHGAVQNDPRLGDCAGPRGTVKVAFEMMHARDIWLHIPGFKGAPELETDDAAHVVVYEGAVRLGGFGSNLGGQSVNGTEEHDVVCVVLRGEPYYYTEVDLSVLKP